MDIVTRFFILYFFSLGEQIRIFDVAPHQAQKRNKKLTFSPKNRIENFTLLFEKWKKHDYQTLLRVRGMRCILEGR
jgi:hypothetical protein